MAVIAGHGLTCGITHRATVRIEGLRHLHLRQNATAEIAAMAGRAASARGCTFRDALMTTDLRSTNRMHPVRTTIDRQGHDRLVTGRTFDQRAFMALHFLGHHIVIGVGRGIFGMR